MMRLILGFVLMCLGVALMVIGASLALAQDPAAAEVVVPWGSWVAQWLDGIQQAILLLLSGVTTYLASTYIPKWLTAFTGGAIQNRVNQVLEKAVLSAIAQTKDAVVGKKLTVPVAYEVLARAAQYAVDQAPALMDKAAETTEDLLKMLMARMEQYGVMPETGVVAPTLPDLAPGGAPSQAQPFRPASATSTQSGPSNAKPAKPSTKPSKTDFAGMIRRGFGRV